MNPAPKLDTGVSSPECGHPSPKNDNFQTAQQTLEALKTLDDSVRQVYAAADAITRRNMLRLRQLIFDVATDTPESGDIIESCKWGQASYATKPKTGSPLRIAAAAPECDHDYELLVVCSTSLISDFESMFPNTFETDNRRVVRFHNNTPMPHDKIATCIGHALTLYTRR